jgi:diadenosine tetraphosphatase ApaH/serine/threonine PP2A family protein phosphatase
MRGMPSYLDRHDCRLVHGAPPDSPSIYLFELSDARIPAVLDQAGRRLCFVGHTHDLELVSEQDGQVWHEPLGQGEISLAPDKRYIVNIGSVGQPRDGDNRAKYAIIDVEQGSLEIRFVAYDIAATVKMIKERGLPAIYGQRLW